MARGLSLLATFFALYTFHFEHLNPLLVEASPTRASLLGPRRQKTVADDGIHINSTILQSLASFEVVQNHEPYPDSDQDDLHKRTRYLTTNDICSAETGGYDSAFNTSFCLRDKSSQAFQVSCLFAKQGDGAVSYRNQDFAYNETCATDEVCVQRNNKMNTTTAYCAKIADGAEQDFNATDSKQLISATPRGGVIGSSGGIPQDLLIQAVLYTHPNGTNDTNVKASSLQLSLVDHSHDLLRVNGTSGPKNFTNPVSCTNCSSISFGDWPRGWDHFILTIIGTKSAGRLVWSVIDPAFKATIYSHGL